ncbi:3-dehydroquinate dehydratase (3-dehydroquinase) (Type II DHQase) [Bartonella clarridgeiae 73]|uniref:3-dehydroquinate dehydratase n=1 Tax=Bartonella clarridgeiae (strain CCUG 45776 / CIP 104772 / 73) TaxID=696125 RepID=E6YG27_BARC7|nr:type II 3-dehydroquinate dehydratase [Bartonella clarridgeiae]WCR55578.1 MAG: 3-dehydroquinate dehydratase II [Bartonella clarridgeiae]CBI75815.1 3-dehydroquinate dehydratase (3-dehydroquinase) (Type II DHQase) [Bartonella clarridgeiae 73]
MSTIITVLNGLNLNFLGKREPEIYGNATLKDIERSCKDRAVEFGITLHFYQSNCEGQLVYWIQTAIEVSDGLIINPGAYGHTSFAIFDALKMFPGPIVKVHLSNIYQRESFRHHSYFPRQQMRLLSGVFVRGIGLHLNILLSSLNVV